MLNFNILSPEEKNRIVKRHQTRILFVWGVSLFVLFVFTWLLLIPSYFMLSLQQKEVLRNLEITKNNPLVERIANIQKVIAFLKRNANDIKRSSGVSEVFSGTTKDLVSALPSGIALTAIKFEEKTSKLFFQGHAETRTDLINLENALKKIERFKDASVPLASLVLNKNIPFSMEVTIQKE